MSGYNGERCEVCGEPLDVGEEFVCEDPSCRVEFRERYPSIPVPDEDDEVETP